MACCWVNSPQVPCFSILCLLDYLCGSRFLEKWKAGGIIKRMLTDIGKINVNT